jgi:hypothetical protein
MRRRDFLGVLAAAPLALGFRAHTAHADVFLPTSFATKDGSFDLVVHFHGMLSWQEPAFERAQLRAGLASVNLGEGSGVYQSAFRAAAALDRVIDEASRAAGAKVARVALSGWSAGFGAIGSLLALSEVVQRVDAVLLEDALHTNYVGRFEADRASLAKFARFAELAMKREKLFVFTHSAVKAPGYASTTECANALLAMIGMARGPARGDALGAHALYASERGDCAVMGFDGGGVEEHRNHVRRFDETALPRLKARWGA